MLRKHQLGLTAAALAGAYEDCQKRPFPDFRLLGYANNLSMLMVIPDIETSRPRPDQFGSEQVLYISDPMSSTDEDDGSTEPELAGGSDGAGRDNDTPRATYSTTYPFNYYDSDDSNDAIADEAEWCHRLAQGRQGDRL